VQKISPNVYVETGFHGCNSGFVVTTEGIVMVDTPMVPAEAKNWAAEIAKHGTLRYVIDGEPHTDHISGNCYFSGVLIGHEGTRKAVQTIKLDTLKEALQRLAPGAPPPDKDFRFRPPEITINDRMTLYLGKHTFQLLNMQGHTPFQVTVYVPEERVVFVSDNINTRIPYFFQSVPGEWLKTLDRLQEMDVDKIVPGHGDVQDKSYLPKMKRTIQTWLDTVAEAMDKGMSSEEAQKKLTFAREFPELPRDERTATVVRNNVARIYEYLKNER
jgi:cyclase